MKRILKVSDLTETLGLSRTTIWRKEREGTFPRRIRLGPNSVGWDADEITAWLEACPRGFTNPVPAATRPSYQQAG